MIALILFSILPFQQTENAPVLVDTPEHKFVAARLAESRRLYEKADAMMNEPEKDISHMSGEELKAYRESLQDGLDAFKKAIVLVATLEAQLKKVDSCTKLYRRTIDRKTSNLTVRETTDVKSCQELDLYPLDMPHKRR